MSRLNFILSKTIKKENNSSETSPIPTLSFIDSTYENNIGITLNKVIFNLEQDIYNGRVRRLGDLQNLFNSYTKELMENRFILDRHISTNRDFYEDQLRMRLELVGIDNRRYVISRIFTKEMLGRALW